MQISNILFAPVQKLMNNNSIKFKGDQRVSQDSFEKSEKEFYYVENLRQILSCPDNEIGHGANNRVFLIPGEDRYVLRVSKDFSVDKVTKAEYTSTDKKLGINIGQKVAQIKTDGGFYGTPQFVEVLLKQEGKSYGVPHYTAITDESGNLLPDELPYEDYSRKISFKTLIDKASEMDVSAYEKMLQTFDKAQELGYSFDPFNSNNILLADNEINMIDFNISSLKCSHLELLNSLCNFEYLNCFMSDPYIDDATKDDVTKKTEIVMSKFVSAMKNMGCKFDHEYIQNRSSFDILRSREFKNAIGYVHSSGLSVDEHLSKLGLK